MRQERDLREGDPATFSFLLLVMLLVGTQGLPLTDVVRVDIWVGVTLFLRIVCNSNL